MLNSSNSSKSDSTGEHAAAVACISLSVSLPPTGTVYFSVSRSLFQFTVTVTSCSAFNMSRSLITLKNSYHLWLVHRILLNTSFPFNSQILSSSWSFSAEDKMLSYDLLSRSFLSSQTPLSWCINSSVKIPTCISDSSSVSYLYHCKLLEILYGWVWGNWGSGGDWGLEMKKC